MVALRTATGLRLEPRPTPAQVLEERMAPSGPTLELEARLTIAQVGVEVEMTPISRLALGSTLTTEAEPEPDPDPEVKLRPKSMPEVD